MKGLAALICLMLVLASTSSVNGYGLKPQPAWNPLGDIINKIKEAILGAISWIADRIHDLAMGPLAPLFQAVTKLVIGNPVPEYGDWGPIDQVSWYEIRVPEMLDLYDKARIAAYMLLPLPIVIGALAIGLEGFGLVKEGEGMLMIKRSLWTAVLIPLSMTLYDYSAHLLSALTHYLCPPVRLLFRPHPYRGRASRHNN